MKKKILLYAGIVIGLLVLAYSFTPQVLGGKIVNQSDISGWKGAANETIEWNKAHPDDKTAWSNSMFGGMPNVTFAPPSGGDWTRKLYNLLMTGRRPASFMFLSLLGAFLLMLALGINPLIAAGGAIAVTFCAYNPQIIQVGHNTKMQAIAFFPWVLAALVFTYRQVLSSAKWLPKALLGAVFFGVALSFQVKANHPQITYYLAIVVFVYALFQLVWMCANKERRQAGMKRFLSASAMLLVFGCVGIATNANVLLPTLDYTPHSMRGGTTTNAEGEKSRSGLDLDYATAWSYGWEELPNLVIPNYNGGSSSGAVKPGSSDTYKLFKKAGADADAICSNLPLYWGPQPFTAGPMYLGAISFLLFVLGLFYYRDTNKWWILAASIFCVLLALGSHFMWFTKICMTALPLYNKFRTVSMSLVALQVLVPVLGFLMLNSMVNSSESAKTLRRQVLVAGAASVAFCLVMALIQSIFGSFVSASDSGMQDVVAKALQSDRRHLLWADTWRSVILIAIASACLFWGNTVPKKAKETFRTRPELARNRRMTASLMVCLLVLVDMFGVGKRYLNDSHFVTPRNFDSQFNKRPVDDLILADKTPSYRVMDLTVNIFNDSHPSYWHKNIGGYSPAKLQSYQEFIDNTLSSEIQTLVRSINAGGTIGEIEESLPYLPGLASMNCKYFIVSDQQMLRYPYARGNAWFAGQAAESEVKLTNYAPNCLEYSYDSPEDGRIVFSEVYYPVGWTLIVDGDESRQLPVELYEGDETVPGKLLRCADVPAGKHTLTMRFTPPAYGRGYSISLICSIILLVSLLAALGFAVLKRQSPQR
ncbi:MAG: hypothetical protein MR414_05210 [Bacteroidales bacterium]|nr:hypothetical protein [Bacteroidales bacterium]